jgi:hypothetical protein
MSHDPSTPNQNEGRFVRLLSWCVANSRTVVIALVVVCVLLTLTDLLYHKHGHFAFEAWFGFFGLFGFVIYVTVVMLAKALRTVIKRPEDYWGEYSVDIEDNGTPPDGKNNDKEGDHA